MPETRKQREMTKGQKGIVFPAIYGRINPNKRDINTAINMANRVNSFFVGKVLFNCIINPAYIF